MIAPRKAVQIRPCMMCQTPFKPRDNGHTGKYCSQTCAGKARRLPETLPCEHCGIMFHPRKDGLRRFCSRTCATRWAGLRKRKTHSKTVHGYLVLYRPGHPMAIKAGYVMEHRLIMAEHLGRTLLPT